MVKKERLHEGFDSWPFCSRCFPGIVRRSFLTGSYAWPKPAASGYHLIKTVSLPDAPGGGEYYDYITVDAEARRV